MESKPRAAKIMSAQTSTGTGSVYHTWGTKASFQAMGTTSSGSGAATILIQCSNEDVDSSYLTLGTISLTLGTTNTSDGFASFGVWRYFRAKVTAISGTGASVNVYMCTLND